MFLAKTWKTVNGKRYESWVLKAGIWDKEHKRYKQIHLAYVGKSRRMNLEKAHAICQKLGITLEELRRVRRLRIVEKGSVSAPRLQGAVTGPVAAETPTIKQTSSCDAQIIEGALVMPNTSVPEHEQLPTLDTSAESPPLGPQPTAMVTAMPGHTLEGGIAVGAQPQEEVRAPVTREAFIREQPRPLEFQSQDELAAGISTREQAVAVEPESPHEITAPVMPNTPTPTSEKGQTIEPQPQVKVQEVTTPNEPMATVMPQTSSPEQALTLESQTPQEIATPPLPENLAVGEALTTGSQPGQETTVEVKPNIPSLIKELRERFELEASMKGYQLLAIWIGAIHITALELRLAEAGRTVLSLDKQKRIEEAWRKPQKGKSE